MSTTWKVVEVIEKPGIVLAELVEVEWFKVNPEWTEQMARFQAIEEAEGIKAADEKSLDWPEIEEFIATEPGEEGANETESRGKATIDITDGPELHPLDNVQMDLWVVVPVDA